MYSLFFNKTARIDSLGFAQDLAGGEVPVPSAIGVLVPCCVQQEKPPEPLTESQGQGRRGAVARLRIFLRPDNPPGALALSKLGQDDRISIDGYPNPVILDGPPFDASGRGVVWVAGGKHYT